MKKSNVLTKRLKDSLLINSIAIFILIISIAFFDKEALFNYNFYKTLLILFISFTIVFIFLGSVFGKLNKTIEILRSKKQLKYRSEPNSTSFHNGFFGLVWCGMLFYFMSRFYLQQNEIFYHAILQTFLIGILLFSLWMYFSLYFIGYLIEVDEEYLNFRQVLFSEKRKYKLSDFDGYYLCQFESYKRLELIKNKRTILHFSSHQVENFDDLIEVLPIWCLGVKEITKSEKYVLKTFGNPFEDI